MEKKIFHEVRKLELVVVASFASRLCDLLIR